MSSLLSQLYDTMLKSGSPDEAASMSQFKTATKFFFDANGIPSSLLAPAADFAKQLNEFGLLRLPYDSVVMQLGPWRDDNEDAAPFEVHHQVVTAWQSGDDISGRLYVVAPRAANTCRATFRVKSGIAVGDARYWDDAITFVSDTQPAQGIYSDRHRMSSEEDARVGCSMFGAMLFMMLGLLSTDGVEKSEIKQPKWINANREKRGKPPIFGYHLLKIDPALVRLPGLVAADGSHASPRLHWRRGHVRHLHTGRLTVVRPCLVGDPSTGLVSKDYKVSKSTGREQATVRA